MLKRRNPLVRAAFAALAVAGLSANVGASRLANPGDCLVNDALFNSQDGGCKDLATGRVWSAPVNVIKPYLGTQAQAVSYCSDLVEGGQTDWRLPTRDELLQLSANGGSTHIPTDGIDHPWWTTTKWRNGFYVVQLFSGYSLGVLKTSEFSQICTR